MVGRRFSIYFTKFFLYLPVTGNQITFLWFVIYLFAAILFCFNNYYFSIIGAILVQISIILDGTDGEVARYRGTCSKKGEYLDLVCHNLAEPLLFIGITIGLMRTQFDIIPLIFGFSAVFFYFQLWLVERNSFLLSLKIDYPNIEIFKTEKKASTNESSSGKIIRGIKIIRRKINDFIDEFSLVMLIAAVFNQLILFIILYGLYSPLKWAILSHYTLKKIKSAQKG